MANQELARERLFLPANGKVERRSGSTSRANQSRRKGLILPGPRGRVFRAGPGGVRLLVPRVPVSQGSPRPAGPASPTPRRTCRPLTYAGPRRRDDDHGVRACTHPAAGPLHAQLWTRCCGERGKDSRAAGRSHCGRGLRKPRPPPAGAVRRREVGRRGGTPDRETRRPPRVRLYMQVLA